MRDRDRGWNKPQFWGPLRPLIFKKLRALKSFSRSDLVFYHLYTTDIDISNIFILPFWALGFVGPHQILTANCPRARLISTPESRWPVCNQDSEKVFQDLTDDTLTSNRGWELNLFLTLTSQPLLLLRLLVWPCSEACRSWGLAAEVATEFGSHALETYERK